MNRNDIVIYKTENNEIELRVQLKGETVWLDAHLMAQLFGVNRPAIVKHIGNIYKNGELIGKSTCSILEQVAADGKKRVMNLYNLDMIISIGYRVNSKRATQFRIWATNVLRKHLVDGYTVNQERLESDAQKYKQLTEQIKMLRKVVENETYTFEQSKELVRIIADYADSIELLNRYDERSIKIPNNLTRKKSVKIKYEDACRDVNELRKKLGAHEFFGQEKDNGLQSALKADLVVNLIAE